MCSDSIVNVRFVIWRYGSPGVCFMFTTNEPFNTRFARNACPQFFNDQVATGICSAIWANE